MALIRIKPNFEAARRYLLGRLESELDPRLDYHGMPHTRDDVLPAIERIAMMEGVGEEGLVILRPSGLFHDAGFLFEYENNEPIGAALARIHLPRFGYSPGQIERVSQVIMATRVRFENGTLRQSADPSDLLQMIQCDADLDNFHQNTFFSRTWALYRELEAMGKPVPSEIDWLRSGQKLLQGHQYYTESMRRVGAIGKGINITMIQDVLGKYETQTA